MGTPRSSTARASSCMERLLRDEQRRKEARLQMELKKEMEKSKADAGNTFKPQITGSKKNNQKNRNFDLLYNDLLQFQQK